MYRRPSKKKELTKRFVTYGLMTLLVIGGVIALTLIISGYQYDGQNGRVEQGSLLQYNTQPAGASVLVDNIKLSGKTPTKSSVLAGVHTVTMTKAGYNTWTKTLNIKAGTLTWLDYVRLVPLKHPAVAVASYANIFDSSASVEGQKILIQPDKSKPDFELVDISKDVINQTTLTLPSTLYSAAITPDISHNFRIDKWGVGERYVLIEHTYSDKKEWLVLDTRDVNASKNITTLLEIDMNNGWLSGTSGNILFALVGMDIRRLDLSAMTISRPLVSNVTEFSLYDSNVITYVGTNPTDGTKRVVGVYRDGDSSPYILRTTTSATDVPLHIATSRYFNDDYVAISEGKEVAILGGRYPISEEDLGRSLRSYGSFELSLSVEKISFSPDGYYVLAQHGSEFAGYDIEHKTVSNSSIAMTDSRVEQLRWLDNSHLWSDAGGKLTLRDFDGTNAYDMHDIDFGQDVTVTENGRYVYSIAKNETGYQLQRVRMILP